MKISQSEIWNFIELIEQEEKGWSYSLHAGSLSIEEISQELLMSLKSDDTYDVEMLPEIFTFREILWQPDVFKNASQSLPGLRILKAYCEERLVAFSETTNDVHYIYRSLLAGLAGYCDETIVLLEGNVTDGIVTKGLGEFRRQTFPIIKFFIYHPQNKQDYQKDAINRLNYAVKIMLTEFHGRYTELAEPYWEIIYRKKPEPIKKATTSTSTQK
jgi:hypothetical protein